MAMKKKFLGLAMAAMVALPASSVYAATNKTIHFDDTESYNHEVKVSGNISNGDGTAATGKIQVELPTSMTFSVNEKGGFTGCNFDVQNKSESGIDVLVSQFRNVDNGITLQQKGFTKESHDRSNVSLQLNGTVGGVEQNIDLYDFTKGNQEAKILNVGSHKTGLITLTGEAGTKTDSGAEAVEQNGASGEFTLIFKIQKDSKQ